jgi:hypothetical protein
MYKKIIIVVVVVLLIIAALIAFTPQGKEIVLKVRSANPDYVAKTFATQFQNKDWEGIKRGTFAELKESDKKEYDEFFDQVIKSQFEEITFSSIRVTRYSESEASNILYCGVAKYTYENKPFEGPFSVIVKKEAGSKVYIIDEFGMGPNATQACLELFLKK